MMKSSVSICPVPTEQQPINEYQELRESWFFRWGMLELQGYIKKLAWVWGVSWIVAGPLAAASFAPSRYTVHFLLCAAAGAGMFLALTLLRLYLGWSYVRDRLLKETIFYEESGWYDGQTWTKPPEILTRDRLIVSYQVQPILKRLKRTFGILVLLVFGGSLIWNFL
ncbi:CGLD27 family protein [Allocoleopsis sp.]|uniref:CGLD27 family protein n=1 Tax=Allocoleopsis sp. TaxID=3088169 RepID=UPI002FD6A3DB